MKIKGEDEMIEKTQEMIEAECEKVAVRCMGISTCSGFSMAPEGLAPEFVSFEPGKPTLMKKPYADFLVAQDPQKFVIEKMQQPSPDNEENNKSGRRGRR